MKTKPFYPLISKITSLLVIFISLCIGAQAQEQGISGIVTSENGSPLAGVTVLIQGTTTGTTTDNNGRFQINAKKGQTLIFRYIGYQEKRVPVDDQSSFSVVLSPSTSQLNEIVVVGYGTQRRQDVTGSVGTVNMKQVVNQPITGANEALAGQIPGVQINTSNGIPGGGPEVVVRGIGAIGAGSQPLYVVDGFPLPETSSETSQTQNPLAYISPDDIESITVLKDASATAIYGSRGANGVVIITTKHGQSGRARLSLNVYSGLQTIPKQEKPPLMNAAQFAEFMKESIEDNNAYLGTNTPIPPIYQNPDSLIGKGTDWFDAITRKAPIQDININVSGGTNNITSYLSGEYFHQEGVVLGTSFDRYSVRSNVEGNFNDKLKLGVNASIIYSKGNNDVTGGQGRYETGFGEAIVASPIPPIYNPDGTYNAMIQSPGTFLYPNPVMVLKNTTNKTDNTRIIGTAYMQYEILAGLAFRSTINIDLFNQNHYYFHPSILGTLFVPPPTLPYGYYATSHYLNWANENSLTYTHQFKGGHSISAVVDLSEQRQDNYAGTFNGSQYPDDHIQTLNAAALITGGSSADGWAMASYLGRINYDYKQKYLLTATIRRDGSSRFGPNNRWGTFPSAAIGWVLTKEPWFKPSKWVTNLKIRASYGITGNDQIGNFTYEGQVGINNYITGGSNLAYGQTINSLANPNLGWEKTKEINIGLDYSLLNNQVTLNADAYQRRTTALLLNLQIPPSSGFSSVIQNVGEVQNTGLEIGINSTNISNEHFSWTTSFNISFNRNKTLSLGPIDTIRSGLSGEGHPTNVTIVGKPVGMFYGYKFLGLYQSQDDINKSPHFPGAIPGNMKVADIDGNGIIEPVKDFTIIGNPYPKFNYGLTNILTYRNWTLRILITGSYGAQRLKASYEYFHNIDGVFNVLTDVIDRWRSPQQPGNGKVPTTAGTSYGRVMYRDVSSLWVYDASYLWFKNILLSYTLPKRITGNLLSDAEIYASVENAFIITPYPFGNPAVTNYGDAHGVGGALVPGIDFSSYPVPRTFTIGIRVNY
ncbi:MAG: TonB-dependent receptor [Thermoflavifilum aggregans]|nr:TonB-dependent receptor [Thermoflavifilum aggregans]